jgi:hypothetical protein
MADTKAQAYLDFIAAKRVGTHDRGLVDGTVDPHPSLFPFQRDIVRWAVRKGCAAIFAAFGLGKTRMQLEVARQVLAKEGGRALIIAPLGVRQEFIRDAVAYVRAAEREQSMPTLFDLDTPAVVDNDEVTT